MIKAILIDDDNNLRVGMKNLLARYCPEIRVVGEADDVDSGVKIIQEIDSDVLFLDIHLFNGTGFDILEKLTQKLGKISQQVVFITAFEQYAIKAFRFSALDYLLKPVDPEELKNVTEKIKNTLQKNSMNNNVEVLLENIKKDEQDFKRLILSNSDGMHVIEIEDIIHCASSDNYTKFYIKNKKPILISKTLKEYEELLGPHGFERIHQSHLINMNYVKSYYKKEGFFVVLKDETKLPVSQRKKEKFVSLLKNI